MMIIIIIIIIKHRSLSLYLYTGLCTVRTMVTPWTEMDTSKLPNIPVWSRELREILVSSVGKNNTNIKSRSLRGVGPLSTPGVVEQFPKYQSTFSDVIDTNSNRLTTDGKQPIKMMTMIMMMMMMISMMMMMVMMMMIMMIMMMMMMISMMMMMLRMMMMMVMMSSDTYFSIIHQARNSNAVYYLYSSSVR
jgi:hypothetical protein